MPAAKLRKTAVSNIVDASRKAHESAKSDLARARKEREVMMKAKEAAISKAELEVRRGEFTTYSTQ